MSNSIGETQVAGGIWRFFSTHFPSGGGEAWNFKSQWKLEWGLQPAQLYAFGEDVFGNQLVIQPGKENVYLWNHEIGDATDLLLDPATLLETVVQSGLDWIDFYQGGSFEIAQKKLPDVPAECHLHWTTPLILGGRISVENTSVVDRTMHLVGHAKLWRQLRNCDPGTIVIPTRSSK